MRRIAELFVAPAAMRTIDDQTAEPAERPRDKRPARAGSWAPSIALLAPPADAPALGAGLALVLARHRRAPAALVCRWSPIGPPEGRSWRVPALPAAARQAAALNARGHDAHATGRLVVVQLMAACEQAAPEACRVIAAAGSAPTVLVLAGPRRAAFDALIREQDLVVAAIPRGADAALGILACAGFERARVCEASLGGPARALAAAGIAVLPSWRRALAETLRVLS